MKVFLAKGVSLCFTCRHCTDECDFVRNNGTALPEYVIKTQNKTVWSRTQKDSKTTIYVVRSCKKYEPDSECVIKCKYCGEEYVLQAQHTKTLDGGYCYDCHVDRKDTYYVPKEWQRGKEVPMPSKPVKCAICGKSFMPQRANAKYCSPKCRELGSIRDRRKQMQKSRQRKKDQKLKQKWELDNETARINKQAENLTNEIDKQYKQNVREVKQHYQDKYAEFRTEIREKTKLFKEQWEAALSKALVTLDEQYQKDLDDIENEKTQLIEKAKEKIMQPANCEAVEKPEEITK